MYTERRNDENNRSSNISYEKIILQSIKRDSEILNIINHGERILKDCLAETRDNNCSKNRLKNRKQKYTF